jgi:hypothetical protein
MPADIDAPIPIDKMDVVRVTFNVIDLGTELKSWATPTFKDRFTRTVAN